jgi:hypothetical protein
MKVGGSITVPCTELGRAVLVDSIKTRVESAPDVIILA